MLCDKYIKNTDIMKKIVSILIMMIFLQIGGFAQVQKIITAEYFWDTDPGKGNATALTAVDGNFNQVIESAIANAVGVPAALGNHTFNVRVKASNGKWGPLFSVIVFVDIPFGAVGNRNVKVTAAEYFWDTDPGQGNANAMIAFDGNFNSSMEQAIATINTTSLSVGPHIIGIRVKGSDNKWSPVFSTIIAVENVSISNRPMKITQAECFWNTDPGNGNGFPMLAFDGNFDQAIESVKKSVMTGTLNIGANVLYVRVKGVNNNWGPKFGVVVNIQAPLYPDAVIYGQTSFCSSQLSNITYFVDSVAGYTYSWSIVGGNITSSATKPKINVNWNASGPYSLQVIETNANGSDTAVISITVTLSSTPPVASSNSPKCAGATVNLSASTVNGAAYLWTGPGFTSTQQNPILSPATVSNTGYYSVVAILNGCPSAKDSVLINVYPIPAAPSISSNSPVCEGDSIKLMAANVVNGIFSWSGPSSFSSSIQNPGFIATLNSAGNYQATVTANGCISPISSSVNVAVNFLPATPTITQIGNLLYSNFTNNNQWYLGGVIINGATSNTYSPTQTGIYTVSQINANGCKSFSLSYNYMSIGIESSSFFDSDFSIVPNPNNGLFEIIFKSQVLDKATVEVLNYLGQTIYALQPDLSSAKAALDLGGLSNGIYSLRIISLERVIVHTFVINH